MWVKVFLKIILRLIRAYNPNPSKTFIPKYKKIGYFTTISYNHEKCKQH